MESKEQFFQKTAVVAGMALICTFLWGSAFPCIKLGYKLFQVPSNEIWSQVLFAGMRFTLAGILVVIIGSIMNRNLLVPRVGAIPNIIKLSAFQTVIQYIFFYVGLAHASGVKSSIIQGTNTFVALFVTCLLFRQEKLSGKKILGCILGFIGVIIVNVTSTGIDASFSLLGEGFVFFSEIAYAISSSLVKKYSKYDDPVLLSGYQFILGGIVLMGLGYVLGGRIYHVEFAGIMMLMYLAFISAVAYSLWGILLKYNPVSRVTMYSCCNPIFGVILSAWWLKEADQINVVKVGVALILVCAGILIVNMGDKKKAD